jgi:hypothetical protein
VNAYTVKNHWEDDLLDRSKDRRRDALQDAELPRTGHYTQTHLQRGARLEGAAVAPGAGAASVTGIEAGGGEPDASQHAARRTEHEIFISAPKTHELLRPTCAARDQAPGRHA